MSLPDFNAEGDLPPGVYRATMEELLVRFASGGPARQQAAKALHRIYELAKSTGHLERTVVFGSFATTKATPNDVDLILVMDDEFMIEACDEKATVVFDHARAQRELG